MKILLGSLPKRLWKKTPKKPIKSTTQRTQVKREYEYQVKHLKQDPPPNIKDHQVTHHKKNSPFVVMFCSTLGGFVYSDIKKLLSHQSPKVVPTMSHSPSLTHFIKSHLPILSLSHQTLPPLKLSHLPTSPLFSNINTLLITNQHLKNAQKLKQLFNNPFQWNLQISNYFFALNSVLFPVRLMEELQFLMQYLILCGQANKALEFPLYFEQEIATNQQGEIQQILVPFYVPILRQMTMKLAKILYPTAS